MRFGRLTAIRYHQTKNSRVFWLCHCNCGNEKSVAKPELLRKKNSVRSCGCLQRESLIKRSTKHGLHGTRTYSKWKQMRKRVYSSNSSNDKCYRDVTICKRWDKYENFLKDMGKAPEGLTLERIDNSKGYSPSNCKWASWEEQTNNKSDTRKYTLNGETLSMSQWAKASGIKYTTLVARLNRGWPIEEAILPS